MGEVRAPSVVRLGPYELGERLGAGGMAEVYVARRGGARGFAKRVAIKRILPQLASDSRFVAMFCDEARICAALSHPNIVQVVDFGEEDGELFMAMEYVDGVSAAKLLRVVASRGKRFPLGAALYIAGQVLGALSYAHEACDESGRSLGIVHRDVSPGNILIGRAGEVKLTDFGIVRSSFVDRRTYPGELKGKLGYMSPEQVIGAEVDPRSDLFTLGIVLAEMLLARPLFPGRNELDILTRIYETDLRVLDRHGGELPEELMRVLRRALARERSERFQSAAELHRALSRVAAAEGITADDTELMPWLSALGVFSSRSGTRESVRPPPPNRPRPLAPMPKLGPRLVMHTPITLRAESRVPRIEPPAYYINVAGTVIGPVVLPSMLALLATGRLDPASMVGEDSRSFQPLAEHSHLAQLARRSAFNFSRMPRGAFERDASALSIGRTLYELCLGGETGLLILKNGGHQKRIFFEHGAPYFVASTDRSELFGMRLVDLGLISSSDVETALVLSCDRGQRRVGEVLVGLGLLKPSALLRALSDQLENRYGEAMRWRQGRLYYAPGELCSEERLHSQLSSLELTTLAVRRGVSDSELAELFAADRRSRLRPGRRSELDPTALGLMPAERAALAQVAAGSDLDGLIARMLKTGTAQPSETLRAVFVGLAVGIIELGPG